MSYRLPDNPPNPEDMVPHFFIRNGVAETIAFPCFYFDDHDYKMHDHCGWPEPNWPDNICQYPYDYATPIHLTEEGYDVASVQFDSTIENLTASASIDDNVIYLNLKAAMQPYNKNECESKFTLFAHAPARDGLPERIDQVVRGNLKVLPSKKYN